MSVRPAPNHPADDSPGRDSHLAAVGWDLPFSSASPFLRWRRSVKPGPWYALTMRNRCGVRCDVPERCSTNSIQ